MLARGHRGLGRWLGAVVALAVAPAALAAPSPYHLVPDKKGGFSYDGPRFRALVHPDGRVTFERRAVAPPSVHVVPPVPPNRYVRSEDLLRALRMNRDVLEKTPALRVLGGPPVAQIPSRRREPNANTCILPNGTDICACETGALGMRRDNAGAIFTQCPETMNVTVHFTTDFNDEYLRALGQDPLAVEKAAFLSSTFEVRMALATRAQAAALAGAPSETPARLERLWDDQRLTARERRRLLFELWLEADRPGAPAAAQVRRAIDDLIGRRLPPGSPDAYGAAELEQLRARPGAAGFDPYRAR